MIMTKKRRSKLHKEKNVGSKIYKISNAAIRGFGCVFQKHVGCLLLWEKARFHATCQSIYIICKLVKIIQGVNEKRTKQLFYTNNKNSTKREAADCFFDFRVGPILK